VLTEQAHAGCPGRAAYVERTWVTVAEGPEPGPVPDTIAAGSAEDWACECGKTPIQDGFYPLAEDGVTALETADDGPWDGVSHVCPVCGIVVDAGTYNPETGAVTVTGRVTGLVLDGETVPVGPTRQVRRYGGVQVCTDPDVNGHRSRYPRHESTAARPRVAEMAEDQRKQARAARRDMIDSNKAWAAAEPVRREFLATLLTRKTPPKGTGQFLAGVLARDPGVVAAIGGNALAASLVGADTGSGKVRYGRSAGLAAAISTASEGRALVLALAVVLASCEDTINPNAWRHLNPTSAAYLGFLAAHGYPLSHVERRATGQGPLDSAESPAPDCPTGADNQPESDQPAA